MPDTPPPDAPPIICLRAPNPGAFTGTGTNTYLLGRDQVVIVDPGPDLPAHLEAILAAVRGRKVTAILITHAHLDHTALVPRLAALTGAEVLAYGDAFAGISPQMQELAAQGLTGGEGSDLAFAPDRLVQDGEVLTLAGVTIGVLHTPGHMGNHICLSLGCVLLTGDHVMGWSTSIVSPPEGDMAAYMTSLHKLTRENERRTWQRFLPGHGEPVTDPAGRLAELTAHRKAREAAILDALKAGPATPSELAARIYTTTAPALLPAAMRNVLAHLIDLQSQSRVRADTPHLANARFRLKG